MSTFIASVIVFGLLVMIHELGHFVAAKMAGIKVHEFSLGFGPKLLTISTEETSYNLRIIPLGGFVRMAGMDPEEENYEDERGFNKKPVLHRIGVILAGPLMNITMAVLLLAGVFMIYGMPDMPSTTVQLTLPGKPAELVGIRIGDKIVEVNGRIIDNWKDLSEAISANPNQEIIVTVERDRKRVSFRVTPEADENGLGKIGISPAPQKLGPIQAVGMGMKYSMVLCYKTLEYLGMGIIGKAPLELGGPVMIISTISETVQSPGWLVNLVTLAAFLSISIGLFNLFPIPALDGSRVLFLFMEALRGRPVEPQKENFIHMIGFALLILLFVVITYNDILRLLVKKTGAL